MSNEILESVRNTEVENRAKVRNLLMAKVYGQKDTVEPAKATTYEQAKQSGDVKSMLFNKLGLQAKQERAEKLAGMMENIDIKTVMRDLESVGGKISEVEKKLNDTIEQYQTELERDFKNKMKGVSPHSAKYMLAYGGYVKAMENIQNSEAIKSLHAKLQAIKEQREDLSKVKAKYMQDNDAIIKEAMKQKRLAEIRESGLLLEDID